jgi:AGCS family alanine or glycine:cation symporter
MATIVGLVIIGGIKRIGMVASRLVPFMGALYFFGAITVLLINARMVPHAITTILSDAFTAKAGVGGFVGSSFTFMLVWGVKRGLFSNEAGQGSAPIAHAAARTEEPVREGVVAMLGPYIDTLLICTLTGLVIITVGVWKDKKIDSIPFVSKSEITVMSESGRVTQNGEIGENHKYEGTFEIAGGRSTGVVFAKNNSTVDHYELQMEGSPFYGSADVTPEGDIRFRDIHGDEIDGADVMLTGEMLQNGSPLTAWAFQKGLAPIGNWGNYIVTIAVFLFAISTAISWSYYGDRSIEYLVGESAILPYRVVFCIVHFLGAIFSLEVVWGFGDTALGLMAIPNLIAIFALSGVVKRLSNDYFSRPHRRYKDSLFGRKN